LDFKEAPGKLTSKLQRLEPPYGVTLIRNDLSLPNESDGHKAHEKYADRQSERSMGLVGRKAKFANEPSHVQGLLVLELFNYKRPAEQLRYKDFFLNKKSAIR